MTTPIKGSVKNAAYKSGSKMKPTNLRIKQSFRGALARIKPNKGLCNETFRGAALGLYLPWGSKMNLPRCTRIKLPWGPVMQPTEGL